MAEKENIRLLIVETLLEVEKKNIFVKDALHKLLFQKQFLSKQNRAFITRMIEGVTEYQVKLDYIINKYSKTKIQKCKPFIRCLLRMGVYQLLYMDSVPDEAACNESVKLAKKKGFQNLSAFVNGVLRNIARDKENITFPKEEEDLAGYLSISYSMPQWIVEQMLCWYDCDTVKGILKSSVETTDLTVRVNTAKTTVEALTKQLLQKQVQVTKGCYVSDALHLSNINYVKRLPGFQNGEFFVQDESSMLLYEIGLTDKEEKEVFHILDLCAAPGGKCTHFAQQLGKKAVIEARDLSEKKVSLIDENIERLGLSNIKTKVSDALIFDETKKEWADIVIADLPCSGLGILSKKNDIKYHLKKEQLTDLINLQRNILANAAEYVKPGGILLYSTCTINPTENKYNAEWFLSHFPFEKEDIRKNIPEELRGYMIEDYMLQLLPGQVKCDGFFISKFRKK